MALSTQHIIGGVRPPRVQITYDVEIGDAIEKKELPFVVGIMADLAGKTNRPIPVLKERQFVQIDRDNIGDVMASLEPRLVLRVNDVLTEGEGESEGESHLSVELIFRSMEDFSPTRVVRQIPALEALYQARIDLMDLASKLDGNDPLEAELEKVLADKDAAGTLIAEAEAEAGADTPEMDKVIEAGNLARDPSQVEHAKKILGAFLKQLQKNSESSLKDPYAFIMQSIKGLDENLSLQLDEVLHHTEFQKLESSWRGLSYLVMNTFTSSTLKLRLLQISRQEIINDLEKAVEFDQSQLFKKIYEEEYGTFGGHPYSCLVADFEFGRHPQDVETLRLLSNVAAAAHAPLLAAASPHMFDLGSFAEVGAPRDLQKIFESSEMIKWNSFRETEDSRYVSLILPHVLMRQPYGAETAPVPEFAYEECVDGQLNDKFCWGNPAYIMAQRITNAFWLYGWTAAIRGVEGGGLVENLPTYTFKTAGGDIVLKCPTEVTITDRREKELSDLGFLSLCHCKGKDYAAFFGAQTAQKPKQYNTDDANANALVSTRLPYILNASRFAHYIKAIMRDKIGGFMSREDVESYLQEWIADYILLSDIATQDVKAMYPLRDAEVKVVDAPGKPGSYRAVIFLRPHFQLEELTVSLRLVAALPESAE